MGRDAEACSLDRMVRPFGLMPDARNPRFGHVGEATPAALLKFLFLRYLIENEEHNGLVRYEDLSPEEQFLSTEANINGRWWPHSVIEALAASGESLSEGVTSAFKRWERDGTRNRGTPPPHETAPALR
jgi:hypothetical protein